MSAARSQIWRDYTNIPFEILIAALSLVPFFVLAYFYRMLPEHVPLFMKLNGEVGVWAGKSVLSVFRVPLMALDTQLICLLMKYGVAQSAVALPSTLSGDLESFRKRYVVLNAGLWDGFRCLVAFKMSAASLDTVFLSLERFRFLSRPAFVITAIAALLSIVVGLIYGYRFLRLRREMKEKLGSAKVQVPIDARCLYAGALYFNPNDPVLFVQKYGFNFANKWAYVFLGGLIAYPVLVFST